MFPRYSAKIKPNAQRSLHSGHFTFLKNLSLILGSCLDVGNFSVTTKFEQTLDRWSTKSSYDSNFIFLYLQYPRLLSLASCYDLMVENLITILFCLWLDKIKATDDERNILEVKLYFVCDNGGSAFLCDMTRHDFCQ